MEEILAANGQLNLLAVLKRLVQHLYDICNAVGVSLHRVEVRILDQVRVERLQQGYKKKNSVNQGLLPFSLHLAVVQL